MSSEVAITLPGDIPGLLRRGAPLRYYGYRAVAVTDPCSGTLLLSDGVSLVKSGHFFVALDLSAPAGRDIAVRWMAEKLGLEVGLTAPEFSCDSGYSSIDDEPGLPLNWRLQVKNKRISFVSSLHTPYVRRLTTILGNVVFVHSLPLDPDQGVEALRLIILHLAGRL